MKILMVCLGNICRSPLAEGIMKTKAQKHGLDWQVDSAGTGSWHSGERPDSRSINTARHHGIEIESQRARQIASPDFDRFDLILAMDETNYRDILALAENEEQRNKVNMIMNYLHPGENHNVPDPYWNDDGFEAVFQMLDAACDKIVKHFKVV